MIRIQREPFDTASELQKLKQDRTDVGGTVVFVGTVRDRNDGADVARLTLEHYPGMTEKALDDIDREAKARWRLIETLIIHRYGELELAEDIVLVIALAAHRDHAFEACRFLIDWLKTKAPFWKLEGEKWVDAKQSDEDQAARWDPAPR